MYVYNIGAIHSVQSVSLSWLEPASHCIFIELYVFNGSPRESNKQSIAVVLHSALDIVGGPCF